MLCMGVFTHLNLRVVGYGDLSVLIGRDDDFEYTILIFLHGVGITVPIVYMKVKKKKKEGHKKGESCL